MGFRRCIVFYSLLLTGICLYSQESDYQTWGNIEVSGEIFNKINFSVSPEIRLFDNSTRIKTMLAEFSFSVPIWNYFKAGVTYRPEYDVSGEYPSRIHRLCLFAQAQYKIERFKISYRGIYQNEYKNYYTSENGHIPDIQHRQKIGLKYNINNCKLSPDASAEMFFTLYPYKARGEKKLRLSAGFDYKINKKLSCSVSYKFQQEFLVNNPEYIHIISLGLSYGL